MIAFVLSGGGNRGALEVGALQALFGHGIQPDLLVGTSAGAMNAAFIAADPSLVGALTLGGLWKSLRRRDVFPGNALTMAWRVLTGQDGLVSSDRLRDLVLRNLPPGVTRFGDLRVHLYTTAADLNTATLYLFGDDPSTLIVDAVMASAALPITFPPYVYHGAQLVDGGIVANVPIEIAMVKGATEIYAIDLGYSGEPAPDAHGVIAIAQRMLTTLIYQQLLDDLEEAAQDPAITLHHIRIPAFHGISMWDFGQAEAMIRAGKTITEEYLANPQPLTVALSEYLAAVRPPAPPLPGATVYRPGRRVRSSQ
ncbi:MAG: patatin-like phospholipase family protein [Anaerolineae bacterium]|nr:patatin-like phospholipase family protein [Anaerolineae bacterium]